uniref:E3 ubiquitin/ISG15 ligase TRIM25-like n=1 Tax=Callorhinchus milii TaxID=7868 RepID=A0A4W3IUH7_CALMI|eukprot:gi/632934294/ref/XP_007906601.1/ PREDICTED: E3 ubiquitin/ISG15 ligase TRIM25-like [Callorhinchus milii]
MAAARHQDDLEDDLTCSICLEIYTNPVILNCKHSFCRSCIEDLCQEQDSSTSSCPLCQATFRLGADLEMNFQLANIVQKYANLDLSRNFVPCTYCTKKPFPAVKTCLKCEVSMCSIHIRLHRENPMLKSHPLVDPTENLAVRKCTEHEKLLEIYCQEDEVLVCSLCALIGNHRGHYLMSIGEAADELRNHLENHREKIGVNAKALRATMKDLQKEKYITLDVLKERKWKIQDKYDALRQQIRNEEKEAFHQLDKEKHRAIGEIDDRIYKLRNTVKETEKSLTTLNNISKEKEDLLFIQGFNSITVILDKIQLEDVRKWKIEPTKKQRNREVMIRLYGQTPTLDPNTAHCGLILTDSRRTVSSSGQTKQYPDNPQRFDEWWQVLGIEAVSYRPSYWEVTVRKDGAGWKIGVCYGTMKRKGEGDECALGLNIKSWCLESWLDTWGDSIEALHNNVKTKLTADRLTKVGVYVDFEGGIISFYNVSGRKLILIHTFHQTFTEPLYPAFCAHPGTSLSLTALNAKASPPSEEGDLV